MTRKQTVAVVVLGIAVLASLGATYITRSSLRNNFAMPSALRPPRGSGWEPTNWGAIVSLACSTARAFPCCSRLPPVTVHADRRADWRGSRILGQAVGAPATTGVDLFLSLPWLFLLLAVRALLPLNTSPVTSVMITFLLLGCLGWAAPARIIRAGTRTLVNADYLMQLANGISRWRLFWRHLLPNLRPILLAQFWISVPLFILSEANLGLLGLEFPSRCLPGGRC